MDLWMKYKPNMRTPHLTAQPKCVSAQMIESKSERARAREIIIRKKNAYWRHFIFPTRAISVKWRVMLWRSGSKYSSDNQLYTGMPSSHTHALTRTPNALFFRPPRFV